MILSLTLLLLGLSGGVQDGPQPLPRLLDMAGTSGAATERTVSPLSPVPAWAFDDPARWDANQCGEAAEAACLRAARNRLALARVDRLEAQTPDRPSPAERVAAGESRETVVGQRCRWTTTPSDSGVGGTVVRTCGDAQQVGEAHRRMMEFLRGD